VRKTVHIIAILVCGASCGRKGAEVGELVAAAVPCCSGSAPSFSQSNLVGRVVSTGDGRARRFESYDGHGRSVSTKHVLDGLSYQYDTAYGFPCASDACTNAVGAGDGPVVVSQTFPDSEVVRYTYDAGGAEQSVTATPSGGATQTIVSRILRNARGQTTEVDYGDGTSTTHYYNDGTNLRLNQLETFLTATPSTILQLYTYAFDGNGNVTGVNDYCNEASTVACTTSAPNTVYSWSYQYDSRNQLVKGTRNGVVYSYTYDALGNLTNKEGVTQTYFPSGAGLPRPHALSAVGAVTYAYDANGNVSGTNGAATNLAIAWSADDMPERTVYGSVTTTKSFLGESLWKKVQGTSTTYYLPSLRVENGAHRKFYGGFAERDISDTTGCTTNSIFGCLKFYHGDHLGSSTLATNAAGSVVHRESYKPYGESLLSTPPGPFTPENQFAFKEREKDGSGLYDFGARMYNPATARFLSADSDDADGLNRYAYVKNNPLAYTDPTGHQSAPAMDPQMVAQAYFHQPTANEQRLEDEDRFMIAHLRVFVGVGGLATGLFGGEAASLLALHPFAWHLASGAPLTWRDGVDLALAAVPAVGPALRNLRQVSSLTRKFELSEKTLLRIYKRAGVFPNFHPRFRTPRPAFQTTYAPGVELDHGLELTFQVKIPGQKDLSSGVVPLTFNQVKTLTEKQVEDMVRTAAQRVVDAKKKLVFQ
jgi:RHS repeat-associated protein